MPSRLYLRRLPYAVPVESLRAWLWSLGLRPQTLNVVRKDYYREKASCFMSFSDDTSEEMIDQWRYWLHGAKFQGFTLECIVPGPPKCLWPKIGSCFFLGHSGCGHHMGGRGTLRESGHHWREGHFEGEWAPWEGGAL